MENLFGSEYYGLWKIEREALKTQAVRQQHSNRFNGSNNSTGQAKKVKSERLCSDDKCNGRCKYWMSFVNESKDLQLKTAQFLF